MSSRQSKPKPPATKKTVVTTLERFGGKLNYTGARIHLDVHKIWGTRGALRVRAEVNSHVFSTTLFPTGGKGYHWMVVNKRVQAAARIGVGSKVRLTLQPETKKREYSIPPELTRFFRESKTLRKFFDTFSESTKREIAWWIGAAKHAETRVRRAEHLAERLLATMDAERELPPLIAVALARNARAAEAWQRMTSAKRRQQLLAIFYYRTPDARARRVQRMLEGIVAFEEKRGKTDRAKTKPLDDADRFLAGLDS